MNEQQRKAMELALEALENAQANVGEWWPEAITAIKEALAQDALQALHDENKSLGLYEKGYADAMNWKVQNHLEHLPAAQPEHDLYTDADKDKPDAICDRNGQVVLAMCKKCGNAEVELDAPCVETQPEQEPVAWLFPDGTWTRIKAMADDHPPTLTVYTIPPQEQRSCDMRTWVGLTDLENAEFVKTMERGNFLVAIYDIEKKLKEKNTWVMEERAVQDVRKTHKLS